MITLTNEHGTFQAERQDIIEAARQLAEGEVTLQDMDESLGRGDGTFKVDGETIGEVIIAYASEVIKYHDVW